MRTDEERIKKANKISKLTKHFIWWDGSHYINEKEGDYNMKHYDYLVIRYYLKIGNKRIPLVEAHDKFIDTLKNTIKLIPLTFRYLFYAKIENKKRIKEYHKAINKLNNKQIQFD